MQININEAETSLAELGELAWQGEEIIVTKGGKPYLTLTPCRQEPPPAKKRAPIWAA